MNYHLSIADLGQHLPQAVEEVVPMSDGQKAQMSALEKAAATHLSTDARAQAQRNMNSLMGGAVLLSKGLAAVHEERRMSMKKLTAVSARLVALHPALADDDHGRHGKCRCAPQRCRRQSRHHHHLGGGDIDMVARAFGMVALLFNSNSGSMMVSAIQFGILVALFMTALVMATTGKVDVIRSVVVILFLSFAIVPTTSVYVASYYDNASVGNNAGAVGFRKVDNIPVGVAYTLGLFSKLGKTFAEGVDTASTVLPDVTWTPDRGGAVGPTAGALSLHGTARLFQSAAYDYQSAPPIQYP